MNAERTIKAEINQLLRHLTKQGYPIFWRMPVPYGYGRPMLDYEGCLAGQFFAIETKAPGKWLTPLQRDTALQIVLAGGKVFIISRHEGIVAFVSWVVRCKTVPTDALIASYAELAHA